MPQLIVDRTIGSYLETLGSSDPTPGGGSVAGVVGALGCGLGKMVIALTKPDTEEEIEALASLNRQLADLQQRFTDLAQRDEAAFLGYRNAAELPKTTPEERAARKEQLQSALKGAASVPLEAAQAAVDLTQVLTQVEELGNPHLRSDAEIAMICATSCFEASRINVNVNLSMIRDDDWGTGIAAKLHNLANTLDEVMPTERDSP